MYPHPKPRIREVLQMRESVLHVHIYLTEVQHTLFWQDMVGTVPSSTVEWYHETNIFLLRDLG